MPLALRCPNGHKLKIPSKFAGQSVRCPACEIKFEVPANKGAKDAAKASPPQDAANGKSTQRPSVSKQRRNRQEAKVQAKGKTKAKLPQESLSHPADEFELTKTLPSEQQTPPETPAPENSPKQLTPEVPVPPEPALQASQATGDVPEAEVVRRPPERNQLETFLLDRKLMGTSPGYRPDQKHRSSTYWLAGGQVLLACFTTIPAFWQMGADQVAPWVYLVLMLAFLQGAYAVWLCLSPDFSSAQVAMFASGFIAAIYAAATAVCWLTEARPGGWFHLGSLKIIHGNKPALWCAAVMLLACLVAYICGHVSYRWQKTYHRLWPVKAR